MDTIWRPRDSLEKSEELTVSQLIDSKEVTVCGPVAQSGRAGDS